jgi:hypothetical protein
MSTQKIYALPVETTGWKFDGATEISFNWEYDEGSSDLLNLYEKGKQQQWDTSTRIDWSQELFEGNPMGIRCESIPAKLPQNLSLTANTMPSIGRIGRMGIRK